MSIFKAFQNSIALYATLMALSVIGINGQVISTACTASMVSSFTPCLNFITGSTGNGASPTPGCCSSVKSLMSGSMDCACLLVTGNVPISLPINRTLALSLPRACNQAGVPLQCKASGVPLPAPGPALFGPTPPPTASSLSPTASKATATASSPDEATFDATPATSPVGPTATPGIRPVLTPSSSASNPSSTLSPAVLTIFLGIMLFNCY